MPRLAVLSHVQSYRWSDSETVFTHTLKVNPPGLAAHVVFGYRYATRGDDDRALAEFDQALQANPGDAAALSHVGNIYLRKGKFAEAAAAYHDALLFGGDHPALNINLGVALAQAGKTEEALAALNEAVARLPDNADAHANLANVLTVRQDWARAPPSITKRRCAAIPIPTWRGKGSRDSIRWAGSTPQPSLIGDDPPPLPCTRGRGQG